MAQYDRMTVLNAILETGVVPVFYHKDVDTTIAIVEACARGGARTVEFTNRGDLAYQVFAGTVRHLIEKKIDVILGVGSIVDAPTAALYIANGTNFVVGPLLNPEVARLCNRRKVAYSPGCGSVSEIAQAEELGVEIVKVFPGKEVGGPGFVKAVLGPCPWTRIMPTGGVESTRESLEAWFKAGVAAVGAGSNLITKELVAAKDWDGLAAKVRQCLDWVKEIRVEMAASRK
ncbi:MAG: bifunctional 4-hydroxy-2-oxoglutarate aldolase/2-dehydro-3-deoxy-phosphogluconate aldolase [Candidatus Latescibacterota bacterium]|jgi:2-dehydro-3-deoxyphosphogluconate aldolase/(4S)-4-hydroxy-2-oxoglutarate aldolase